MMVGLILACLVCGYGFYRMNNGDVINAAAFTFGIMGIILSIVRNRVLKKDSGTD